MIFIEWVSETSIIPGHGVAERGEIIGLPDKIATQFVAQGYAKLVDTKIIINPEVKKK